jgi:ankyrin repeat protein
MTPTKPANPPSWYKSLCRHIKTGKMDLVKRAVENGANIHKSNDLPLFLALLCNKPEIFAYLLEKGAVKNDSHHYDFYLPMTNFRKFKDLLTNHERKEKLERI